MDEVLKKLKHITVQERDLPRLFDFGEIYGVLGTTADSVASAVYSLFAELFKGYGTQSQFAAASAYRYYSKFPIESATTCLSSARYRVISDKLKVDPHFVRFPRIATMKTLMPKASRVTFKGGVAASLQENVFMLAGSSNKKSTILKLWRRCLQKELKATLKSCGLHRMVCEDEDNEQGYVDCQELFWHLFNPRMTYEGLIDQANKAWEDGPRLAIMIDELSLVMAASRGSNLSLDELLLFLDEESECGKTAASVQRKLVDPAISAVLGCQWDCLQEVIAGPGRNLLARFTVVSTQECRSLEEIHEQDLLLDMRPAVENGVQTMEVLLRMAWLQDGARQHGVQVDVTWDNTRLLNAAHNAMKRAAVDYGETGDPMLVWVRKADALLRQCFIGTYLEVQSDLSFLSEAVCFTHDWQPSLLAFAAINAACRSALDVRVAHTEGYGKKQHSLPTRLPARPNSIDATHQQVMEALVVQNPHLSRKKILERARSVCSGALKGQWANGRGLAQALRSLCDAQVADVVPTQETSSSLGGDEESISSGIRFQPATNQAAEYKAWLETLPLNRRSGLRLLSCVQ